MTSAELLAALVRTNLVAGAAIPAVLALRKPARRLFGANIAYSLWALAPAAALASLLPARRVMVAISPVLTGAPERSLAIQPAARAVLAAHVVHGVAAGLDPTSLLLATWLAGAILSVAFLVWRQRQFLRQAAQGLVGPAVVGVLWPRIVTPGDFEERYSADERAMILAHEGMHIARQDARINAAVALVQCGCWFNPLIHAAAYFLRIDQEIACDAAVQAGHMRQTAAPMPRP